MKGFLLPVVPEEDLRLQRLNEAPEQAGWTVETQRGWSVIHPALFRRQLLIFTSRPLQILSFASLWHFWSEEKMGQINGKTRTNQLFGIKSNVMIRYSLQYDRVLLTTEEMVAQRGQKRSFNSKSVCSVTVSFVG